MNIDLRNICFIRHAKSSWEYPELPDIDRPLNKRGYRDAEFMSKKLHELEIRPDIILTSPANRAKTTARYFAEIFELRKKRFIINDDLYSADADEIIECVQKVDAEFQSIFLFGHNPTLTYLANMFPGVNSIDNVPTCGIVQVKTMVSDWSKWSPDVSAFTGFYYPKQYLI